MKGRQYFVSHEPAHLTRAIELFQAYLAAVETGGRRADATDALAQLEPLALALPDTGGETEDGVAPSVGRRAAPTRKSRLMVRCQTPKARISLDGAAGVESPLIAETNPGAHRIQVEAPGFFPVEQDATAIEGALVPIEIVLRERPATVLVDNRDDADVYVDGLAARANTGRIELTAGTHWIAFGKNGHVLESTRLTLEPGQTQRLTSDLAWTHQRVAAVTRHGEGDGTPRP
jgi:hypothetical protein